MNAISVALINPEDVAVKTVKTKIELRCQVLLSKELNNASAAEERFGVGKTCLEALPLRLPETDNILV